MRNRLQNYDKNIIKNAMVWIAFHNVDDNVGEDARIVLVQKAAGDVDDPMKALIWVIK